jgi:hypothetical protein
MIATMAISRTKLVPAWELYYPFFFGLAACAGWLLIGHRLACFAEERGWHFDQLYVAFFGFASITTGFLATFYGTVQSMSAGFIQRIRGTKALTGFLRLSKRAILMGFAGCIATVPMLIIQPVPIVQFSLSAITVAVWLGIAVWTIAGFWRVARWLFLLFETDEGGNQAAG